MTPWEDKRKKQETDYDLTGAIMDFEGGQLTDAEIVTLFQRLIDTGLAWKLQGMYGRAAQQLIARGLCRAA